MTPERMYEILRHYIVNGSNLQWLPMKGMDYLSFHKGDKKITLDGDWTAEELEAIAFWMRTHDRP